MAQINRIAMTGVQLLWGCRSTKDRVLCGGSWNNNHDNARVANHNRNNRNNSNNNIGFRLVSHIFLPAGNAVHLLTTAEAQEKWRDLFPAGVLRRAYIKSGRCL
jgi:hypothetical protein